MLRSCNVCVSQMIVRCATLGLQLFLPITILACLVRELVFPPSACWQMSLPCRPVISGRMSRVMHCVWPVHGLFTRAYGLPMQCCRHICRRITWRSSTPPVMWHPPRRPSLVPRWATSDGRRPSFGVHSFATSALDVSNHERPGVLSRLQVFCVQCQRCSPSAGCHLYTCTS